MSDQLKITIAGIRGTRPGTLTDDVVVASVEALCEVSPDGPIVVSFDGRDSGPEIYELVKKVLATKGREILDGGCVPLPTTQVAVIHFKAAAGICVTASHNPPQYNGLKMLNSDGEFIDQHVVDMVQDKLSKKIDFKFDDSNKTQITSIKDELIDAHINLFDFPKNPSKLRVAHDANNASASEIVPKLLEALGCEVIKLANDQSKSFVHTPEPVAKNLFWTKDQLKNHDYDLCCVTDPDADRLVLIDEKGEIVSEECSIPLVALNNFEEVYSGPVVINKSTSMMTEILAKEYGNEVHRSAVGEKFVIEKMKEVSALIGGEGSGGIVDSRIHYGRDSLVGIYHIIQLMRKRGQSLSQIINSLPKTFVRKENLDLPDKKIDQIFDELRETFPDAQFDTEDGLLITFQDKMAWLHVRPSNTEPLVRCYGEALDQETIDEIFQKTLPIFS